MRLFPCPVGPLEGGFHDPGDAFASMNLLGDLPLARGTDLFGPPDALVLPFGVLPEDDEVYGRTVGGAKGRKPRVQQSDRAEIDVQVQPEPKTQQDVPRMFIPRHPRISQRPDEDRVGLISQVTEAGIGKSLAGLEVVVGGVEVAARFGG